MSRPAFGRVPFLAAGIGALGLGLWTGLARMGLAVGAPVTLAQAHGPLMVVAFLGAVIGTERAVALDRPWAWLAPAACALGGVGAAVGAPVALLAAVGMAVLVGVFVVLTAREPTLHMGVMLGGAGAGAFATFAWAVGLPLDRVVYGWILFLVATIAGERLELTRLAGPSKGAQRLLTGVLALTAVFAAAAGGGVPGAAQALGVSVAAVAAWLLRFDVARRTWQMRGLPRYSATCLMVGYGWLLVGGLLLVAWGPQVAGLRYDAQVHTIFVGFVFSMILGHAPIVFPAVLRVAVPFHRRAWLAFGVLHLALGVRVLGDLRLDATLRTAGGVGGVVAILLFLLTTLSTMVPAVRKATASA